MKKFLRILALAATMPVMAFAAPQMSVVSAGKNDLPLEAVAPPASVCRVPARVVTADGFLYENFESVPDDSRSLPEGWIATSTPGLPSDTWHAGTLGRDGTPLNGVSGYKYAYILGNRESDAPHDAWLFSPGLRMEAGTRYTIEFFALMPPVTGSDQMELLQVCIGMGADAESMTADLDLIESDNDYWRYYSYTFTPASSGTYHIGFHSLSPSGSNSTVIDDLKISSGPQPIYSASAEVGLGTTDTRSGLLKGEYRISNGGQAPLEVSLVSASEGVSVEGLPLTLDRYGEAEITIKATCNEAGEYTGSLVLATNDLTLPTVTVKLTGTVEQARVTGYYFEDFENGGPEGWKLTQGAGNVAAYGGYNSSRAYYTTTYYGSDDQNPGWGGVGFLTHYVEMGDEPEISFWYQMANVDFSGNVNGPAESEKVEVYVQVSEDGGATFDTVYTVKPGSEHEHVATLDFANIKVAVPQYAGKTCRVRVVFNQPGGASFFDQVRVLADDVSVGTKSRNDLRAAALIGETLLSAGSDYDLKAAVQNLGTEDVSDYTVELIDMTSGERLAQVAGPEVKSGGSEQVTLRWTAGQPGAVKLQARIVFDSDPVTDNNDSYPYIAQVLPAGNTAISINHGEMLQAMAYPINFYAVESMTQSIYPANEIGTTEGVINSLVFTSYLEQDFYGEPFTVFVGETDKSDFADGEIVDPATLVKVFDGSIYMQAGMRDLVIPFDDNYDYHGGNLVVMCQKLGKEFVLGESFIIRKCNEEMRSIQATTYNEGTLVESGYADRTANDVYPQIRFNIVKALAGKVSGRVTTDSAPVAGAVVRVAGTQRTETTDGQGNYSFGEIAAGECVLEVFKHGYYDFTGEKFTLAADAAEVKDMNLTKLPRYTVQGTVTSETTGDPVKNVRVQLRGYDDYVVMTDEQGHYSVADMAGDTGHAYAVQVTNGYFHPLKTEVMLVADETLDFVMKEKTLRVHNVKSTSTASGNLVTWEEPMPEFRYDSGEPIDYIGWTHGNSEVIVGSAFYKKARIKEISWYATDRYGRHQDFNVFIFGLDSEGKPNPKNILYAARNVKFTDNAWSSHILSQPVEADGFMIAVSCSGFMGLGICGPDEEYPFEEGQCYYAGDSYTSHISAMSTFAKVHPMLRAYGEDDGDMSALAAAGSPARVAMEIVAPKADYKVYRCPEGQDAEEENLVATVNDLNWLDTQAASGKYRYAVVASYPAGDSEAAYSDLTEVSSADMTELEGVALSYDPSAGCIYVSGCEKVAEIALVGTSGIIALREASPAASIDVSALPAGVYLAVVTLREGTAKPYRLMIR